MRVCGFDSWIWWFLEQHCISYCSSSFNCKWEILLWTGVLLMRKSCDFSHLYSTGTGHLVIDQCPVQQGNMCRRSRETNPTSLHDSGTTFILLSIHGNRVTGSTSPKALDSNVQELMMMMMPIIICRWVNMGLKIEAAC